MSKLILTGIAAVLVAGVGACAPKTGSPAQSGNTASDSGSYVNTNKGLTRQQSDWLSNSRPRGPGR
ncbi:MAG: hypothetical protein AAF408_06655 [Pseudomonadota bacterium]